MNLKQVVLAYAATPASPPLPGKRNVAQIAPRRRREAAKYLNENKRAQVKPRVPRKKLAAKVAVPPVDTTPKAVPIPKVETHINQSLLLDAVIAVPHTVRRQKGQEEEGHKCTVGRRECTVVARNAQLKALAKRKHLDACLSFMNEMRESAVVPDKYSYSIVLTCCARLGAVDVARDLYRRMRLEGIVPDDYIRTNLLTVAANAKPPQVRMCARLFATMRNPTVYMCNVMIDAYARAGNVDSCIAMCRYMRLCGLEADKYTMSALIKAYVKSGRIEEAFQRLREMHAAGLELSAAAFGQVIDAFGKLGLMDRAVKVFDLMTLFGVAPTQATYNTLIAACSTKGMTKKAYEIFEEMKATSSFVGDRYTIHSLMSCCLKSRDATRVMQLYRMIKKGPFMCNQVSYRYALTAAGQSMDIDAMMEVKDDMETQDVSPREDTAAALVAAAIRCSDLQLALDSFAEYKRIQRAESEMTAFFAEIKAALKGFEESREGGVNDFECTVLVVDELERSWERGRRS